MNDAPYVGRPSPQRSLATPRLMRPPRWGSPLCRAAVGISTGTPSALAAHVWTPSCSPLSHCQNEKDQTRWTDFYGHAAEEGPLASRPRNQSEPQRDDVTKPWGPNNVLPSVQPPATVSRRKNNDNLLDLNKSSEYFRLLGGEVALWTERIDFTNLACRTWPRAAAVADTWILAHGGEHFGSLEGRI